MLKCFFFQIISVLRGGNVTSDAWTLGWLVVSCGARGAQGTVCPYKGSRSSSGLGALSMPGRVPSREGPQAQAHIVPACQEADCRAVGCWSCKVSQTTSTWTLSQGKYEGKWRKYSQVWAVLFQNEEISHRVLTHSLLWSWTVKLDICLETRKKNQSSVPWAWDHSGPEKL